MHNKLFFCKFFLIKFSCSRGPALVWYWFVSKYILSLICRLFHFFVWCMKVSRESSRAYMKLVWWTGDWVPANWKVFIGEQTKKQNQTNNQTMWWAGTKCLQIERNCQICTCELWCKALVSVGEDVFILVMVPLLAEENECVEEIYTTLVRFPSRWWIQKEEPWTCPLRPGPMGSLIRNPCWFESLLRMRQKYWLSEN